MTCCDISKAFDTIDHNILLMKLQHYGIRGPAHKLLTSFLSGRTQYVEWNRKKSSARKIKMGVAQGSVLSAKLFLLYVNDLPACLSADKVCLFADDTSIVIKAKDRTTLNHKTEVCINEAIEWFNSNKLRINLAKTKTMVISTKYNQEADTIKFLGIYMNTTLKWGDHVDYLQRKLSTAIFMIRPIRKISTYEAARTVYFSHFQSVASYGIWYTNMG